MVTLKEKEQTTTPPVEGVVNTYYKVIYDLQTAKQAKKLESVSEVMAALECSGEGTGILNEISSIELVYGGGNGGSGDSKWIAPKVLKIGTTSVNGSITFDLAVEVIGIKITGYIHKSSCKIQAGDSNSADWDGGSDGKTTIMSNTGMTVISKDVLENGEPSTITIYFESTKSLKLAVTNTTPLYITGIEFITEESN